MKPPSSLRSNFAHLQTHDEQLLRLGMLAERYFAEDPNVLAEVAATGRNTGAAYGLKRRHQ
jgi:hypothetical protein